MSQAHLGDVQEQLLEREQCLRGCRELLAEEFPLGPEKALAIWLGLQMLEKWPGLPV